MDASRIISRLGVKGATDVGGSEDFAGFLLKLNADGEIPLSAVPSLSLTSITVVLNEAARLALAGTVQVGDVAKQTDNNKSYILASGTGSADADWVSLGDVDDSASTIVFTPVGGIVATNVQAAVAEVDSDLSTHIGDATKHLTTAQNTLLDAIETNETSAAEINYTKGVTSAIQTQLGTNASNLSTHIADATKHLTTAQNTLLDAIETNETSAAEINYTKGVTSAIQTQLGTGASNLSTHISDATKHLTTAQNTLLDAIETNETSAAEINYTKGVTSAIQTQLGTAASNLSTHISDATKHLTTAQNTLLDAIETNETSAAEINYTKGVTSAIQTQLGTAASNLSTHISDATKHLTTAQNTLLDAIETNETSAAEINYSKGVTSAIQTQLNNKQTLEVWVTKTNVDANYVASAYEKILTDTSIAAFSILLPPTPTVGTQVEIVDKLGTFGTNHLTVDRNLLKIDGATENLVLDVSKIKIVFVYSGVTNGWIYTVEQSSIGYLTVDSTARAAAARPYEIKTTAFTAEAGKSYGLDTSLASFNITLPAIPSVGTRIEFFDAVGSWEANPPTILRNGNNLEGQEINFTDSAQGTFFAVVFVNVTIGWRILEAGAKPQNLTVPVITGYEVGSAVTSTNGTWTGSPTSYSYQWQISDDGLTGWADITDETASTYTPIEADEAKFVRAAVSALNSNGTSLPAYSLASATIEIPVFPSGALAFWRLSDLTDASGNAHTLTNNNTVTFGAGKIGNAAIFDDSKYLSGTLAISGESITVSAWVKNAVSGGGYSGYSITVAGGDSNYGLYLNDSGIVNFNIGGIFAASSVAPINDDLWHHVVGVGDPVSNEVRLYVDGSLVATVADYVDANITATIVAINSDITGVFGLQIQSIDAVGVWSRALSAFEIGLLYAAGTGLEPA